MKHLALTAALLLAAGPALAFHCPEDMAKIDAAIAAGTDLSEDDLAEVKELRVKGEELHEAGDHAASVEELAKALQILGLD